MKVTMPAWHEDARRLREAGHSVAHIAVLLKDSGINVSESRVSQVTGQNWQDYIDKDRVRYAAQVKEIADAKREGRLPDIKAASRAAADKWSKEKHGMSDRGFEIVTSSDPSDNRHKVKISCSHEGCDHSMIFAKQGVINPVHAAKWFRDKGWCVGNKPRQDLCPDHHDRSNKPHHESPKEQPAPANGGLDIVTKHSGINDVPVHVASTEPRPAQKELTDLMMGVVPKVVPVMSRTDRRIVFNKLEEVYVDEFIGYKTGWSDLKVSIDLGCPTEWVSGVRDENFGPEITEVRKMSDLIKLGEEIKSEVMDLEVHISGIKAATVHYDKMVESMDKRLDDYDGKTAALTVRLAEFNAKLLALKGEEH